MFTFSPLQITLASAVSETQKQIIDVQNQLSAGKRTLNAGEYGIVTRLTSQASGYDTAVKNITAAQSVISVGASTLTSIASIATQLKNLAVQGSSAGLSDNDRQSMAATFNSLFGQLSTLSTAASINGNNLISSASTLSVRYDPTASISAFSMTGVDMPTAFGAANTPISIAVDGSTLALGTSTFSAANAATINTEMTTFLDTIATAQGTLTAYSVALDAMTSGAKGVSAGLNSTVDSIQNVDSTAMQAKLQSLNNQQSIDYYLVSQMNTESAAILAIFR
jgi:flagellin-like hook-associated protein FlgL